MKKKLEELIKAQTILSDINSNDIIRVENTIEDVNSRVFENENDIEKLKQSYFTGGQGIVITDNRPMGMDSVEISVDTNILAQPRIDILEQQVAELEITNKILAQYIYDEQKNKNKYTKGGTPPKLKRRS